MLQIAVIARLEVAQVSHYVQETILYFCFTRNKTLVSEIWRMSLESNSLMLRTIYKMLIQCDLKHFKEIAFMC